MTPEEIYNRIKKASSKRKGKPTCHFINERSSQKMANGQSTKRI